MSVFILKLKLFLNHRIRIILFCNLSIQFINILHTKKINIGNLETRMNFIFHFICILRYLNQIFHWDRTIHWYLRFWMHTVFTFQSFFFWFRLKTYQLWIFIFYLLNYVSLLYLLIIFYLCMRDGGIYDFWILSFQIKFFIFVLLILLMMIFLCNEINFCLLFLYKCFKSLFLFIRFRIVIKIYFFVLLS